MPTSLDVTIRGWLARYLAGEISLPEFEEQFVLYFSLTWDTQLQVEQPPVRTVPPENPRDSAENAIASPTEKPLYAPSRGQRDALNMRLSRHPNGMGVDVFGFSPGIFDS